MEKLTKDTVIERFLKKHGDKYDYKKFEYINNSTKSIITCPIHGDFEMRPNDHMCGQGCPKCKFEKLRKIFKSTTKEFITKAKEKHGDKYDYSKVEYVNNKSKVCIICHTIDEYTGEEHGEFWQSPSHHLQGKGCPICNGGVKYNSTIIKKYAEKIHGEKNYNFDKIEYINRNTPVTVVCPIHGEFSIRPDTLLNGSGCKKCGKVYHPSQEEILKRFHEIHGDTYIYDKFIYKKMIEPSYIICRKHGPFKQAPIKHLYGQGCPTCALGRNVKETNLYDLIKNTYNDIEIIHSYHNKEILGKQSIDIYIPKYKIGIEYQGEQHFKPVDFLGKGKTYAEKQFEYSQIRDKRKKDLCLKNGIALLYYHETEKLFLNERVYNTFKDLKCAIDSIIIFKNEYGR